MPRIPDDFVDSCIYLYPSKMDADQGAKIGGSGFLFGVPTSFPHGYFIYAVSNRHVIEQGSTVIRLNTKDGRADVVEFTEPDWIFHPNGDDLAVAPVPPLTDLYRYKFLGEQHLLTKQFVDLYNVGPGDDVFVVGRFVNQDGKQQNTPSVRFGNLAQMPPSLISVGMRMGVVEQESFIAEARSIGGYSGSAVYLALSSLFIRPDRPNPGDLNRVFLLGINWGYICDWAPVCDAAGEPIAGMQVRSNTGMMAIVPAWKLKELTDVPKLVADRKKGEQRIMERRKSAIGVVTSSEPAAPSNEENPTHRGHFTRLANAAAARA